METCIPSRVLEGTPRQKSAADMKLEKKIIQQKSRDLKGPVLGLFTIAIGTDAMVFSAYRNEKKPLGPERCIAAMESLKHHVGNLTAEEIMHQCARMMFRGTTRKIARKRK